MVVYFPDFDTLIFHPSWSLGEEAGKHDWSMIWVFLKGEDDRAAKARRCASRYRYDNH
jgi:hypothetical protein